MNCSIRHALVLSVLMLAPGLKKGWAVAVPPVPPATYPDRHLRCCPGGEGRP
jgi:hypothetical protein